MAVLFKGETGKPLKEIIKDLGNKSYPYISCRCKWTDKDGKHDEYWGACSYNNETKMLSSLDGDSYSLDDLYNEWEEWADEEIYNGEICLTVWEYGRVEE